MLGPPGAERAGVAPRWCPDGRRAAEEPRPWSPGRAAASGSQDGFAGGRKHFPGLPTLLTHPSVAGTT